MKRFVLKGITIAILVVTLLFPPVTSVFADTNPIQSPTTGQPGAPTNTCGPDNPATPGNAASAPGSPFNGLTGEAGEVYAGNPFTASLANSNSTATVSQYDVACVQLSH